MARRSRAPLAVAALLLAIGLGAIVALRALRPVPDVAPAARREAPPPSVAAAPPAPAPPSRLPIRIPPASASPSPDDAPASFEGRVVSTSDGAPVAGADLTFSRAGAAASVRTGADGAFRFEPPAEGRWLLAAVTAAGFLPFAPEWGHSPVQLDARGGRHVRGIEIHLVPARTIVGRVVDEAGAPVAGADVRLLGAVAEAALVPIPDRFATDAAGEFRFAAPEGASLVARKEGFLPGRAEVDWQALLNGKVSIRLGPAHRAVGEPAPVEGRVVARGGGALPGALVVAAAEGPSGGGDLAAQAVAGEDGRFVLKDLDPGSYRITARAEGHAPALLRRVRPGATDLLLELGDGARLHGCVRDASTAEPIALFTVVVLARRGPLQLVPQRSRSVVDPAGCYAMDDLAPGQVIVIVSAPGYAPSREQTVEIPPPGGDAVADAALERGGRVEGRVHDEATGAPIAGARVAVEGALADAASTFPLLAEATSREDGTFTLAGLPPRVSLLVGAAAHHGRVVGVDVPRSGAGSVDVALRPAAEGESPRVDLAGIGVVIAPRGDGLAVAEAMAGGGAAEAGLARGDLILRVDGRPVTELGFTGAVDAIRGPEGTRVLLTVRRGDATFDVQVPRRLVRG